MRNLMPEWMSRLEDPTQASGAIGLSASPNSALPAMTVRRGNKGIGRYLTDSKVLVLKDEADREAALDAVERAGFEVLRPLVAHSPDDLLFNGEAKPIGAWGNVIGFYAEIRARMTSLLVALVDLDKRELLTISDELKPALLARLARMGVAIEVAEPPNPVGDLNGRLDWFTNFVDIPIDHFEPRYQVPTGSAPKVSSDVAAELPAELVAAFEEQLLTATFDPMPVRSKGSAPWERTNGVLDAADITAYRKLAPRGLELPEDWDIYWNMAMELSAPHAPSLCALFLHDFEPEWWDALPLTPYKSDGTWLLGHSMANPHWMRQDKTLESERRLQCAVSLVVNAVADLKSLRKESREKVDCALCGRPYEKGMLQAGDIYQMYSARVCERCRNVTWPMDERDLTPVQREGLVALLVWYTEVAGGAISIDMLEHVEFPEELSVEASLIIGRQLPGYVTSNWVEWLGQSGVLGDSLRPSYGLVTVAADGHMCRSFLERVIDDFLSINGIEHETEPLYPYDELLNQHGSRADWRLADGTFVEAAGLLSSPDYAAKMARKQNLASKHGIPLVVVTAADLNALSETFDKYM